jgi:fructose-1,6-bisphosphatase/inositol monophosphatase family enzyme
MDRFPDHGIFGEEGSQVESGSQFRWIIDPIDGTRSFAAGVPLFGVMLALESAGAPVLGCCHYPAFGDTIVAAIGAGCWQGERRVHVSACDRLRDARVVTSGLEYWRDWATPAGRDGFDRLVLETRFSRTWGDCFGYTLIATGNAEIMADPACGALWDYAPVLPIVIEAGGQFTTLGNLPLHPWSTGLASNARLHGAAVSFWGQGRSDMELQTEAFRLKRWR